MSREVVLYHPDYDEGEIIEGVNGWKIEDGYLYLWTDDEDCPAVVWAIPDGGSIEFGPEQGGVSVEFVPGPALEMATRRSGKTSAQDPQRTA